MTDADELLADAESVDGLPPVEEGERGEDAELLVEAAGYLESFIREQYHADHPDGIHPAQQRKYDRDMELVEGLREVAARLRSTPRG